MQENGNAKNPQIIGIDEIWFNGLDQCIGARKSEQTMTFSLENILESMSPSQINLDYENGSQNISYISGLSSSPINSIWRLSLEYLNPKQSCMQRTNYFVWRFKNQNIKSNHQNFKRNERRLASLSE